MSQTRSIPLLIPLLLGAGCGDKDTAYQPLEGEWGLGGTTELTDTCNLFDPASPKFVPEGYDISGVSADGFTLQGLTETSAGYIEWNAPLDCILDTGAFACTPFDETDSGDQGGESYTITYTWTLSGTLSAEDAMDVVVAMDLSCDDTNGGAFCSDIEDAYEASFPCALQIQQAASFDG